MNDEKNFRLMTLKNVLMIIIFKTSAQAKLYVESDS